jgi:6-pyruvoyl-tetrahydropterin synthase
MSSPIRQPSPIPRRLKPIHVGTGPDDGVVTRLSFELGIDSFFGASHAMRPDGARHTHSFRIQATFVTDEVDDEGMVVGFREVSDLLEREAKRYANCFINDIPPFDVISPTGENIATVVFKNLAASLETELAAAPKLVAVTLWESPTSYVKVRVA